MKRIFTIMLLVLLCSIAAQAQELALMPLVREGVVWHYAYEDFEVDEIGNRIDSTYKVLYYKKEFIGDTILNGIEYKKCYTYYDAFNPFNNQPSIFAREDEGKIIFANLEYKDYYPPELCLSGRYYDLNGEYIPYDFGDMYTFLSDIESSSALYVLDPAAEIQIDSITTTMVGNETVKCYHIDWEWFRNKYIEGVGVDGVGTGTLDAPFTIQPTCECPVHLGLTMLTDMFGNILYRGTYYNKNYAEHFAKTRRSDINQDGMVDIADVNAVINMMLGKSTTAADVNGDGQVDISDVNAVINAMLGK